VGFSAHCDRTQILGGHDCPHTGAAVGAVAHVDDGRQARAFFGSGTALGDLNFGIPQLLLDERLCLGGGFSPQCRSVAQLGFAVVNPEVLVGGRFAGEDDAVKPGKFQLRREKAAALGIADAVHQRGASIDAHAALPGDGSTGGGREHPGEDIGRIQAVNAGGHMLENIDQAHGRAADVGAVEGFVGRFHPNFSLG